MIVTLGALEFFSKVKCVKKKIIDESDDVKVSKTEISSSVFYCKGNCPFCIFFGGNLFTFIFQNHDCPLESRPGPEGQPSRTMPPSLEVCFFLYYLNAKFTVQRTGDIVCVCAEQIVMT